MRKIKIIVAYDGTDFFGWQKQVKDVTISSTLEKSFYELFGQKITLIGCSRTDRGVHALWQVAIFKCENLGISLEVMRVAWNNHLPSSILIRELSEASEDFHPCFDVLQKTYYYHLFLNRPLPFFARFGWHYKFIDKVDFEQFYQALQLYVGEHDFASFCKVDDDAKNTVRRVDSIHVEKITKFNMLCIVIKGPGFLRFQIRRMVGYALDVARRDDLSIEYLNGLLKNPDHRQTLTKAEGCGLCLRKVIYK
jgi:tRNA pseudouridine38-40 synthase